MEPRVSLITLGVSDLSRAIAFYRDGLGWPVSSAGDAEVAFLRTSGAVLALWSRDSLAEDARVPDAPGTGFSGVVLAQNVRDRAEVDSALSRAVSAGATLLRPAEEAFWGGYYGHFADPDGFVWEVAWNPGFPLAADGSIELPE